jgi:hypothetical protein
VDARRHSAKHGDDMFMLRRGNPVLLLVRTVGSEDNQSRNVSESRFSNFGMHPVSTDTRQKRDTHALDENGMVLCNPRDKEAAHRAQMEGIATDDRAAVTCRKCLALLYKIEKARNE